MSVFIRALILILLLASPAASAPATRPAVPVYDFTYAQAQPTGEPSEYPFRPGRWWLFSPDEWEPSNVRAATLSYTRELQRHGLPVRTALLDTEGLGHARASQVLPVALDALQQHLPAKVLVIGDLWPGIPDGWSYQRQVRALEGTSKTRSKASNADRAAMFELAGRHRPIVRRAGVVVVLCVIDRITGISGHERDSDADFYIRRAKLLCAFYREAYAGTEICVWTTGQTPYEGPWNEIPVEHCKRLRDALSPVCDSFALFGERERAGNLAGVLEDAVTK